MPKTKLAVTLEASLVEELDQLVSRKRFANRSQAIESAVAEKLSRMARTWLGRECAKLDQREERASPKRGWRGAGRRGPNTEGRRQVG